ncbi:RNA binding protein [Plasmodium cynomolgi strain B]|uniref:RNA binding protein n=1 Tax=Plasmodium cynomolgi (strain B) TaxID=1120755 RepID=K6UWS8_PLACD|nr:RNA binding protein [Plasmodium cynomolgi strain B]GAB68129.1 RNA binding protein [Plasmodium cynomolgi strain B]
MTDVQIQNQTSLSTSKKEFESRYDERALRILCVKNISKETKESELLDIFKQFGSIESINLKVNTSIGPYAIYAHVLFSAPEEAKRCLKQMNGKFLIIQMITLCIPLCPPALSHDGMLNDDSVNPYDSEATGFREHEVGFLHSIKNFAISHIWLCYLFHANKRLRTGGSNSMENVNLGSASSLTGLPSVNGNDVEINKLVKTYEENKVQNKPTGDAKNRQVEEMLQSVIKDGMNKPPRIKLYLCDHLRQCAQHVFNRPAVDISVTSNTINNTHSSTMVSKEFKGNIHMNANATNPGAPLYHTEQNNLLTGGKNSSTLKEPSKHHMLNNGIANKEGQLHGNEKLLSSLHSGGSTIPNMGLNNPTSNVKYALWKGTLEMKNKENLSVIGYAVNGDVKKFLNNSISSIVISHRKKMKTLPKIEATYYFQIENKEDENILDTYRNYFNSKDRVGLSSTSDDWHMYIIFPGSAIFKEFCNSVGGINSFGGGNSSNNFNNIFLGVVCYNPQFFDKKDGVAAQDGVAFQDGVAVQDSVAALDGVAAQGGVTVKDSTAANFNQQESPMTNVNQIHVNKNFQILSNHHQNKFTNSVAAVGAAGRVMKSNINGNNHSNLYGDFAKQQGGGGPSNAVANNFPLHSSNTFNNVQGVKKNNILVGNNMPHGNSNNHGGFPNANKSDGITAVTTQVMPSRSDPNVQKGAMAAQNNSTTQLNQENDTSNELSEPTRKEENKNEVPNWLNQFSSLAAYLVKK